jgi:aldehyde:ferredoxin oxidoreductase
MKAYYVRDGQGRKDDSVSERFYREQVPDGPQAGAILDRKVIESVLDEYYEVRGWDKKSGRPTRQKLTELGLADIADDLQKHGKLP